MNSREGRLFILMVACVSHATAQTFTDAISECRLSNFPKAAKIFRELAEKGDPAAANELGCLLTGAKGIEQDLPTALHWFKKAAEQGELAAQCNLALMMEFGHGTPQNYQEAIKWYKKAANSGDANAQCALGFMLRDGRGFDIDLSGAAGWFRMAAEGGDAEAQFIFGGICEEGAGVPKDYVQAYKWYNLAKAAEAPGLIGPSANAELARDRLSKMMTTEQIAKAQQDSTEWWTKQAGKKRASRGTVLNYILLKDDTPAK